MSSWINLWIWFNCYKCSGLTFPKSFDPKNLERFVKLFFYLNYSFFTSTFSSILFIAAVPLLKLWFSLSSSSTDCIELSLLGSLCYAILNGLVIIDEFNRDLFKVLGTIVSLPYRLLTWSISKKPVRSSSFSSNSSLAPFASFNSWLSSQESFLQALLLLPLFFYSY